MLNIGNGKTISNLDILRSLKNIKKISNLDLLKKKR